MTHIWVPSKDVYCPLCDEPFQVKRLHLRGGVVPVYHCRECSIFTYEFDASFNKWRDTDKTIPCSYCNTNLKWFSRFLDQYFKAVCPGCGIEIEKDLTGGIAENGQVELEDFVENQPEEETIINIPVDKLNLPEEKKAKLKHQIRQRKEKKGNG